MKNQEYQYVVTWDGYSEGHDAGHPERKHNAAHDLDQCRIIVNQHKDRSPKAYRLGEELDVAALVRQHDEAVKAAEDEKQAVLAKLSPHDRKVLRV